MTFYLKKKNLTTKMKLYTTSEYMNNDISFEKNKKINLTAKINLYTTGEL